MLECTPNAEICHVRKGGVERGSFGEAVRKAGVAGGWVAA
jgi:hypothetical protein